MRRLILGLLFMGMPPGMMMAQSYSSVQYNINNGLAASTVYGIIQDKDGFIWFATEGGLSRYDGTHFKTFTTTDGLPDNEILKIFQDSRGRIWMLPFKNAICYYLDGKIHNQQNDSALKKINISERLLNIIEDSHGTIWTNEQSAVYKIFKNNSVEKRESLGGVKLRNVYYFGKDKYDRIWFVSFTDNQRVIYKYENNQSLPCRYSYIASSPNDFLVASDVMVWRPEAGVYVVSSEKYLPGKIPARAPEVIVSTFSFLNDSMISMNTVKGARLYNLKTGQFDALLAEGKSISAVIQDREGNWWVSTLGEGVFRIPSDNFKNLDIKTATAADDNITLAARVDSNLYLISTHLQLIKTSLPGLHVRQIIKLGYWTDKVYALFYSNGRYILVSSTGIYHYDPDFTNEFEWRPGIFTKSVQRVNNILYLATHVNVVRFDMDKFGVIDTIWDGRSTAICIQKQTVYIGTLHGLYAVTGKDPPVSLGDINPLFKSRISTLNESGDGSLWVGTTDNGLVRYKNGKVIHNYTMANGLSSNICKTICIDGNIVWLGTNKGLNRIDVGNEATKVTKITQSDGLSSDEINRIMAYGDTIFVGTPEGITYFNKQKLSQFSECRLNILDISGNTTDLLNDRVYKVRNKTLRISYVGISYKSSGDILYKYRLSGSDDDWKTTRETSLEFISLPYGRYDLELIAENKFGVVSNMITIKLEIPIPFWKTPLFYMLAALGFIGLVFWLYKIRLQTISKREREKTNLNKKLAEMKLKALRAQMNPHFTFNVLNSIQYYIGYNDTASALNYLAKFSKLIRLTLDNSKHTFITLGEEKRMLKLYLDLERMRVEDKFDYDITADNTISDDILIPNMLIQPFVENAIKHGFKEGVKNPRVEIRISDNGDSIRCTITDNGIGRADARKSSGSDEHKPAGVAMVMDKAEALEYYYNYNISVEISDLQSGENESCGTIVFIKIPKQTTLP